MKPGHQLPESRLLSKEENSLLLSLLGVKCQSLASGVVQLFLTDPPDHGQWRRKDAGVMCLVKDHMKRSYFFRLYCLSRRGLVWENELYNSLEYTSPQVWLHSFEADACMAAFNFADEEEARLFKDAVLETLYNKRQKRQERRSRTSHQSQGYQGSVPNLPSATGITYNHNGPATNKHQRSTSSGGGSKKKESKRLTKADIGLPQNFRHVSHVGWDPNKGFDGHGEVLVDPHLKDFFAKAGVSDNQLRDRETREFIYDFIQSHGGLDIVKQDAVTPPKAPPVPSRAPPPQPMTAKPSPPPPPNVSNAHTRQVPTQVNHQRIAPPPPPPPSLTSLQRSAEVETSRHTPAPAPPPPPPPPLLSEPTPPAPRLAPACPPAADPRSALMDAIKSGATLKHVDVEKKPHGPTDSRGELLDQIRQGVELKSVQHVERPTGPSVPLDGLAGALARALAERNRAFHNDSDSESDSDADGESESDEWED